MSDPRKPVCAGLLSNRILWIQQHARNRVIDRARPDEGLDDSKYRFAAAGVTFWVRIGAMAN
jgi:hypothetical protein